MSVNYVSIIAYPGCGSVADIILKKRFNLFKAHWILEKVRDGIETDSKPRI